MLTGRGAWAAAALAAVCVAVPVSTTPLSPVTSRASVTAQLDAYLAGDVDNVVAELERLAAGNDLDRILDGLKTDGAAWIETGGPAARPRRVLAAATFALEAGRAGAFSEWKWIQRYQAEVAVYWRPPPELIEWGCQQLRTLPAGSPGERVWHLAALAASQRAGDFEFLIGSPYEPRHNVPNQIEHLKHSVARVPTESRLLLGQAIALEWTTYPGRRASPNSPRVRDAMRTFEDLARDQAVGAEARVRLGSLQVRTGRYADAIRTLSQAEHETRDPYLVYLANYLRGEAHRQAGQAVEAEAAYRRALETIPRAQSAALSLAGVLFLDDRRAEAAALTDAAVAVPMPMDPWRVYARADDRFWSRLIGQLREAIR